MTNANSNIQSSGNKSSASKGGDDKQSGKQGFASMDPDRQREIAAEGGRASHSGSGGSKSNSDSNNNKSSSSKVDSNSNMKSDKKGVQGGTPAQHAEAGRQSHKNTR